MSYTELLKEKDDLLNRVRNHPVYKQVLSDSFGGVMYNVANQDAYDTDELLSLMNKVSGNMDGIMRGAYDFLKG